MNRKALYKRGDILGVKDGTFILKVKIMSIINSPDEFYYTVQYLNGLYADKQYDCLQESKLFIPPKEEDDMFKI